MREANYSNEEIRNELNKFTEEEVKYIASSLVKEGKVLMEKRAGYETQVWDMSKEQKKIAQMLGLDLRPWGKGEAVQKQLSEEELKLFERRRNMQEEKFNLTDKAAQCHLKCHSYYQALGVINQVLDMPVDIPEGLDESTLIRLAQ